jgi:uncharacterized protein YndB with AHSA1/START domain
MTTKTITQVVTLPAPPAAVFAALMNEKKHTAFTDAPAKIDARVGGAFRCYGGYLYGITLELVPGKLIVQAWRSRHWPKGFYSIVTFALAAAGVGKTKLHFTQVGVPARDAASKTKGWSFHYWEPLKRYLAGSK